MRHQDQSSLAFNDIPDRWQGFNDSTVIRDPPVLIERDVKIDPCEHPTTL
jgi:hypothetical protein